MRRDALGWSAFVLLHAASAAAVCTSGTELVQSFPTAGGSVSEWKVCWNILRMPDAGGSLDAAETLVISESTFRPGAEADPVSVLGEIRMSEIFVPYNDGGPRFLDLTGGGYELQALTHQRLASTRGAAWEDAARDLALEDALDLMRDRDRMAAVVVDAGDAQEHERHIASVGAEELLRPDLRLRVGPRRRERRLLADSLPRLRRCLHQHRARKHELLDVEVPQPAQ